jgi:fructokinase
MILVCGEALIDLFVRQKPGRLETEAVAGGSPFNVAIGLSRLSCPTGFLSTLSEDAFGDFLADSLRQAGVELDLVRRCPERTTLSVVATADNGHPHYSFYADSGADRALTVGDLPTLPPVVSAIVAGSYALGVEPIAGSIEALLRRESGRRIVSLDPNVRPLVVGSVSRFRDRFEGLLSAAHIVKASLEDLQLFYGEQDPATTARGWLAAGPRLVIITRGEDGPLAFTSRGSAIARPARRVAVVDTVGAGDSFHAGLLAFFHGRGFLDQDGIERLSENDLAEALDFAVAAASLTCGRRGANPPTLAEVERACSTAQ